MEKMEVARGVEILVVALHGYGLREKHFGANEAQNSNVGAILADHKRVCALGDAVYTCRSACTIHADKK